MTERNLQLDNVKGCLITLVVIGHFMLPLKGQTRVFTNVFFVIYTFHMAAFVFLSGIFSRHVYDERTKRFRWDKAASVLLMYVFYQTIVFFSEIPAYGRTTRFPDYLHTSGAPWYLLALLIWYLLIPFFSYYRQNKKLQWAAFSVLVIMSLTSGYLTGIGNFLALDRVTAFAPFFFLGYFFSEKDLIEWLKTRQSLGIAVAGIVAGVLILFFFYDHLMPYQHIVYGTWYSELPVTQFPTFLQTKVWLVRLLWYLVAFSMTISLIRVMPSEQIPFLTRAGKRSLTIYIVHRPIRDILLSCGFIRRIHPDSLPMCALLVFIAMLTSWLLSFRFPAEWVEELYRLPTELFGRARQKKASENERKNPKRGMNQSGGRNSKKRRS